MNTFVYLTNTGGLAVSAHRPASTTLHRCVSTVGTPTSRHEPQSRFRECWPAASPLGATLNRETERPTMALSAAGSILASGEEAPA